MGKWLFRIFVVLVLVAAALVAAFLFYHQPVERELEEARRLASLCAQERSTLSSRVNDLESMLGELRAQSEELETQVREKEELLAQVQSTQDELVAELQQEIADGQIQVNRLRDQLSVDMVDEILFDSGEATLKREGQEVLRRVATVLASTDRRIQVQGHTDDVPIVGRLAETYATNWELSAARAVGVVRFLQEDAGLDPRLLTAAALSEYQPRADNDTPEGRAKNRRIEIVLLPRAEEPPDASTEG